MQRFYNASAASHGVVAAFFGVVSAFLGVVLRQLLFYTPASRVLAQLKAEQKKRSKRSGAKKGMGGDISLLF